MLGLPFPHFLLMDFERAHLAPTQRFKQKEEKEKKEEKDGDEQWQNDAATGSE